MKRLLAAASAAFASVVLPPAASAQEVTVSCGRTLCQLELSGDVSHPGLAPLTASLVADGRVAGIRLALVRKADAPHLPAPLAGVVAGLELLETPLPSIGAKVWCHAASLSCDTAVFGKLIQGYSDSVFEALVARANAAGAVVTQLTVVSPGGSVIAGLAIGRRVHRAAITVEVSDMGPNSCASACTFIFLASRTGRYGGIGGEGWNPARHPDSDNIIRRLILFHNWRYDELDRITDQQYLSGIENATEDVKRFLRDIDMPEIIADWAQAIPARETRPLSPSQWRLVGEYPPALNDLIFGRCGALFDDWREAWDALLAAIGRPGTPEAERDRRRNAMGDLRASSHQCVESIIRPIQREAQLGR